MDSTGLDLFYSMYQGHMFSKGPYGCIPFCFNGPKVSKRDSMDFSSLRLVLLRCKCAAHHFLVVDLHGANVDIIPGHPMPLFLGFRKLGCGKHRGLRVHVAQFRC